MLYPYLLQLVQATGYAGAGVSEVLTPEGAQLAAALAASRVQSGGVDVDPEMAGQAVSAGLLVPQGNWRDGVLQALGLVCEMAWGSGPLSSAVEEAFEAILPESFPTAAAAAAAAAMSAGSDAPIEPQLASSLVIWQQHAALAGRYRTWKAVAEAAVSGQDVAAPVEDVVAEGQAIAGGMLELAREDGLGGVVPGAAAAQLGPGAGWEELEAVLVELQEASPLRLVLTTAPAAEGKAGMDTEEGLQVEEVVARDVAVAPYTPLMVSSRAAVVLVARPVTACAC
jgi:hypothetical protein